VFRKVAPELPRPIRIPGGKFWGAAGYVCSLLLCYYAGWMTMINVMTVVVLGLPIYASYASVRAGWSPKGVSGALSLVFTLVWVFVGVKSGWLFAANYKVQHWSIGLYAPVFIGLTAAFVAALFVISNAEGRKHIRAGEWILPALIGTTFIAYFGESGPQPILTSGTDAVAVIALAIGTYWWAVHSGYRTWEMDQVVERTLADAEEEKAAEAVT